MTDGAEARSCCAIAYESEIARWLMGDSFHPGGLGLTERLGEDLGLRPGMRVLDVASGRGTSALFLAGRFGCQVTGVELGTANVAAARAEARVRGLDGLVAFESGDAERLPFADGAFDAAICECAFCLFPDKATAAREIARVLTPGGQLGLTDLVREGALSAGLDGLMAWVACIADARPADDYVETLSAAGLRPRRVARCDEALAEIADRGRKQLFAAEVLAGLGKLSWPGFDFRAAGELARQARQAIGAGQLGYVLIIAGREPEAGAGPILRSSRSGG
jgi:ubiquinone/menaquinone biosynthesis C-methylase UbiE